MRQQKKCFIPTQSGLHDSPYFVSTYLTTCLDAMVALRLEYCNTQVSPLYHTTGRLLLEDRQNMYITSILWSFYWVPINYTNYKVQIKALHGLGPSYL